MKPIFWVLMFLLAMIFPSEVIAFQQGASSNKIWPSKFTNYSVRSLYECAYNRYSLTKFGLWAKRELKINDAVHIPAGWIGSDSFVNLMYVGSIDANIYSNGSISFVNNSLPIIKGDVLYRTSAKLPKMDSISGVVHHMGDWGERSDSAENYHLSTFSLVDRAPIMDSLNPIMIEPGAVIDLNPIDSIFPWRTQVNHVDTGTWYGDVTVKSGATLILHGGYYRIGQLNLEPSSKVEIHFNGKPLYVEVAGNLYTKWGAQFVSSDGGAQGVMWMVHGQEVFLQNDLQEFWGSMIADSAKVSISSYAGLRGQIFAKDIEVHQYNRYLNFIPFTGKPATDDADSDGLNDSLELAIGTNPNDSDSDRDGLSDGLEYWGRGTASDGHALHRFGAVLDLRNGLYVKENQDTLLNPLRRDVIRRVLWQPDDGYDASMQFRDALLPALEHIASEFGIGSHYPQLHDSGFIRRGANWTALHFDAGPGFSVNWPSDSSRWGENAVKTWGGAQIVPAGGVDTGVGPYSWDLPRDQMVADDSIVCNTFAAGVCYHYAVEKSPDKKMSKTEGDSLIAKMARMHRMSESFDDALFQIIVPRYHAYYDTNNVSIFGGITLGNYILMRGMSDVSWAPIGVKNLLMHELGHSVGIYPFDEPQWTHPFYSSVMRYGQGRWGCDTTEWDSSASGVVKGTWHNQRKCGDSGWVHPLLDSNTNQRFFYCMRSGILDSSARDRWTGWNETLGDLVYSEGRLCNLDLSALNEKIGLAICYDRNHVPLAQPINGTPIDWNGNGVIDGGLVDIFTDTITRRKWLGSSWLDTTIPVVNASQKESDVDEWKMLSEYSVPAFANIRNSHCGFLRGIIANDCKD